AAAGRKRRGAGVEVVRQSQQTDAPLGRSGRRRRERVSGRADPVGLVRVEPADEADPAVAGLVDDAGLERPALKRRHLRGAGACRPAARGPLSAAWYGGAGARPASVAWWSVACASGAVQSTGSAPAGP